MRKEKPAGPPSHDSPHAGASVKTTVAMSGSFFFSSSSSPPVMSASAIDREAAAAATFNSLMVLALLVLLEAEMRKEREPRGAVKYLCPEWRNPDLVERPTAASEARRCRGFGVDTCTKVVFCLCTLYVVAS